MLPEEDCQSRNLEAFIQMYTISRITNSPAKVNSIFATDLSYSTSPNAINLLQEICDKHDPQPFQSPSFQNTVNQDFEVVADEVASMKSLTSLIETGSKLGKKDYGNYFGSAKDRIQTGCCIISSNRVRKK